MQNTQTNLIQFFQKIAEVHGYSHETSYSMITEGSFKDSDGTFTIEPNQLLICFKGTSLNDPDGYRPVFMGIARKEIDEEVEEWIFKDKGKLLLTAKEEVKMVPMKITDNEYNIKILQDIRKDIIKGMKLGGFPLATLYNISAAQNNSANFELKSKRPPKRGELGTTLSRMKICLEKIFQHPFPPLLVFEVEGSNVLLKIEAEALYLQRVATMSTEDDVNKKSGVPKQRGRKTSNFGQFRDDLIVFIQQNTSVKLNDKTNGFYVTMPAELEERQVLLHCAAEHVVFTVVNILEKEEFYSKRIAVRKNVIHVWYEAETNKGGFGDIEAVKKFFEVLIEEGYKNDLIFTINTPATIASTFDEPELVFQFKDPGIAATFCNSIDKTWNPEKNGAIVKCTIAKVKMKNFLLSKAPLINIDGHKGLSTHPINGNEKGGYVHMSTNYDEFHFLPFNRKRKKKRVMRLVNSMRSHGVLSFVTIAYTDCIDGVLKMWIVDGQHRFDAMVYDNLPILYTVANVHSKKEMVRLIAELNNTSQTWALKDYINNWNSLKIHDYEVLSETLQKTKLPVTLLLEIFSGFERKKASEKLQEGKFSIEDEAKSKMYVQNIDELRRLLPKSRQILSSLLTFFRQTGDGYNNEKMKVSLIKLKNRLPFAPDDKNEEIIQKLGRIYAMAA